MQPNTPTLPELRQDLQLIEGPATNKGEPSWLVHDPVRHRYFRLTERAFELLAIWQPVSTAEFRIKAQAELNRAVADSELQDVAEFLFSNNLTVSPPGEDTAAYTRQISAANPTLWATLTHRYLFFKIPLVRPEGFLIKTMPLVEVFYTRTLRWLVVILTVLGLYLATRQWDSFKSTFLDFLSLEGAALYALSLIFTKTLHELGHAYTATRKGVRVNTMGVAFMVLMPLLYTDVTDSWRLKSRRDKLSIDAAGMGVELAIAGIATFLWAFLPDGPIKSIAFILATTSWIMSLAVNLNPFMRFDGYYLLADAWGIPNLQTRSFALAKWWLREKLFKLRHPAPEQFAPNTHRALIVYAIGTWIYRLILFIGIALIVYHLFFKALGVLLFAVEIFWFILRPMWSEIKEWWKMRSEILANRRSHITALALCALLLLALIPWRSSISFQAVATAETELQIFAPRPALIKSANLHDGAVVEAGDILLRLHAPELAFERRKTELEVAHLIARRDRIAGDPEDRLYIDIIEGELQAKQEELRGLKREQDRLTIRAPFAAIVKDLDPEIAVGQWVDNASPLARLVEPGAIRAKGYIDEEQVWRVADADTAVFIPEDALLEKAPAKVKLISKAGVTHLDVPYLASVYGGDIASDKDRDGTIVPRSGHYLVEASIKDASWQRAIRGTMQIDGQPESFAAAAWRRILQVLVRESGV
jgi:putative peptide zinc metalloprotease protein